MSSARTGARHVLSDEPTSSPRNGISNHPNRRLDFGRAEGKRKSVYVAETRSPFKPTHALRRSTGHARPDLYDYPQDDAVGQTAGGDEDDEDDDDEDVEPSIELDEPPVMLDDDADSYPIDQDLTALSINRAEASQKRGRGRPRKSDQSTQLQNTPLTGESMRSSGSGTKRSRASLDHSRLAEETSAPPSKRKRKSQASEVTIHRDGREETIDPSLLAHGDEYVVNVDDYSGLQPDTETEAHQYSRTELQENVEAGPSNYKGRGRPKGSKGKPKERDANRSMQKNGGPSQVNGSPSKMRGRGGSVGPVSNVNLRATTPFEDAGNRASRFGRNLIQPLKYWENESLIWKQGEIEGIIRAEPVVQSRAKPKRKKKSRKNKSRLHDIEEESETESILPDEWEEEMGVITGNVANWDPLKKEGDANDPVQEGKRVADCHFVSAKRRETDFTYRHCLCGQFDRHSRGA